MKEGYSYVPGSNNNKVETPGGEVITRRQYRNIEARERGATSAEAELRAKREAAARDLGLSRKEYVDLRRTKDYKAALKHFHRANPDAKGNPIGGSFDRAYYEFLHAKVVDPTTGKMVYDNRPDGPRAEFLVSIGLRKQDWGWAVGETDKHQKRGGI